MPTLWLRLSQEATLPARLAPEERARLEALFAPDGASPWSRALARLGLCATNAAAGAGHGWLSWRAETPYFNWSTYLEAVSAGCLAAEPTPDGGWRPSSRMRLLRLPALLRAQWRASRLLAERLEAAVPPLDSPEAIEESLALGLALQAVLFRLPRHEARELAGWLADPARSPARVRGTVTLARRAQERRTRLSAAWERLFPPRPGAEDDSQPDHYWEGAPAASLVAPPGPMPMAPAADAAQPSWSALPVCPGRVTGRAVLVPRGPHALADAPPERPRILVFAQARPETTELFGEADAIVFVQGGAMSHACTVARERGIPCVTAAGRAFLAALEERLARGEAVALELDGSEGQLIMVPMRDGWK